LVDLILTSVLPWLLLIFTCCISFYNEPTKKEVKEIVKDKDVAMIDPKQADIDEILDELGIGLKFESEDETEQLEALAIMADDEQYVPIYLYGKKNGKESSEKSHEESIKKAIDKYKKKKEKEKKNEGRVSSSAVGSNYSMQGTALKLTSSLDGTPFWYTEYRAYEGSGNNSSLDYYYLRADHDYDGDDLSFWIDDLYGFRAKWWKDWSDMDLLDPEPESDSNYDSVTISLPGGISWDVTFDPDNLDIYTDIEVDEDSVIWEVERFVLENLPISDDNYDFDFTHGVYIESDEDNDGFRMNVRYDGWTDIGVFDEDDSEWYIRYDVIFEDSNDDIDMG